MTVTHTKPGEALVKRALEVPHACPDPTCPGDINRRKLAAFDALLAACKAAMTYVDEIAMADAGDEVRHPLSTAADKCGDQLRAAIAAAETAS